MTTRKLFTKSYKTPEPGEEIVISGIAGRFPESKNVEEFKNNLLNKVDMVTDDNRRWKLDHPDIPQRTGKINDVNKFDALFFGVHFKQAHTMDPMCRILLEHAYEAIIDAGVNPKQLRGSRTGVFVGACFSESEKTWFYEKLQVNGFGITGCSRAMLANRISYWLGVTGPSYTLDSACSSSLIALEHAYRCLQDGQCDAALVGGSNLCLHPYVSLQFSRLGVLSPDGRSKAFDADANGYARSETICVIYLQKAKNAKRIYATVVYGKTNCDGYKQQGITFPSSSMQATLLEECYKDCNILLNDVFYIECHGTGTKVGDPEELHAIEKVFFEKDRPSPLLIGSVKSNMGHAEPASGLSQVAKIIIAMESGIIPSNLHFNRPREGLKALEDGRIKVVTEPTPWKGSYAGINSFGFGGANCHIVLKSHPKNKINDGAPSDDLPRLVIVSGRTEDSVKVFLDDIERHPVDIEYIRLLHDIHFDDIQGHLYRGYTVVGRTSKAEHSIREVENYLGTARPLWFVFSGMGSQWPGMGTELMRFPVFAEAIKKCDAVLRPRGVDIINILTNKDKTIFNNILHSFVGIAAVQIGLVDLLTSVGIVPDNIIGHSVGELGCAYADGCFTAEQMILSAYSRGLASIETEVIYGSMAAVGLGYEDIKDMCPPDIEVACHNASDSSTISGPAESMKKFIAQLQAKQIFAKEVPCSNIPYHSRYIAPAGPKLLAYMNKIIPQSKPRSRKWLSTSVPRNKWSTAVAKLSSAEYHTNNLLNPVLFEETARLIPKDAVTIEIAPHALLQAILRRSLGSEVTNIGLTQRGHRDNVEVVLQGLGKLYNAGLQPDIAKLYPLVEYPVSRGTPMIAPSIRWEHTDDWFVTAYKLQKKVTSGERTVIMNITDDTFEYMIGHVIDGKNLIPAIGYLAMVWETMGTLQEELYTELSVVFEDVSFMRAIHIPKEGNIELIVMIQKGTGRFEISEGSTSIVTGLIRTVKNPAQEKIPANILPEDDDEEEVLTTKDIYKELRLRGYQYSGIFRSLKSASLSGNKGHIAWMSNWVTFLDNMLQIMILGINTKDLYVPTKIRKIVIDTKLHQQEVRNLNPENRQFPVFVYKEWETIISGGVEIRGVKATAIPRRSRTDDAVLEEYKFVAHRDKAQVSLKEAIRLSTQIALEYHQIVHIKTIELIDDSDKVTMNELASPILTEILGDLPLIQAKVHLSAPSNRFDYSLFPNVIALDINKVSKEDNIMLVVGIGLLSRNKNHQLEKILSKLKNNGFVLTRERSKLENLSTLSKQGLDVILEKSIGEETIVLLKKKEQMVRKTEVVHVNNNKFTWLEKLNSFMNIESETNDMRIILVSGELESGLLGFVNCLRKEPGGEIIRSVLIQDTEAPKFSLQNSLYSEQLQLDLPFNVLKPGKVWGSYRHQPLPSLQPKLVRHAHIHQTVPGDLSSLRWIEGRIRPDINQKNLIHVVYSALNFKDVMITTGKLVSDTSKLCDRVNEYPIGYEYAGIDTAGRRVMGLCSTKGITNFIKIKSDKLFWYVPDNWSLEDAATVPSVYATCYLALYQRGNMKKGDKVLIHSGTGGIGQAAIHLALYEGCEVFTTVGTPEKRKFIREMFPSIPDDHIYNSHNTNFEQIILQKTNGEGVDIILNSLAKEKFQASVRCLATGGRFLEIGKIDLANNPLGMMIFLKEVSFYGVMLDNLISPLSELRDEKLEEEKTELHNLLNEGLKNGAIKPLVRKVFEKDELETAFRYMTTGKHIGKILLKICDEKKVLEKKPILADPRYYCDSNKTYLILGGLGGFGLELADWLILRGAKNIVLTSRTGIKNGYQRMKVELWKSYGVNVLIITGADASNRKDCEFILNSAEKQGPVDAIFNLAVVLKDCIYKNQTPESFEESFRAKAWATKMLDELSRKLCPQLQQFVVFSSVSCGRGNPGQTNYGMANSIMERICERRAANGLPGLAIQWGAIGEVGLVAEWHDNNKELVIGGTLQQMISSCLEKLEIFLLQNRPVVSSMVVAEKRVGAYGGADIVEAVINIMNVKDKTVAQNISLTELGMDSMMGIEIKQTLERKYDIFLTAQDIRNLNFAKLVEMRDKNLERQKAQNPEINEQITELSGIQLLLQILYNVDLPTETCMELQTRMDPRKIKVFLLPSIQGCGQIFNPLASKIRPFATVLQYGLVNTMSISEYADHLLPYVLPKAEEQRGFAIVGYSYGSLIALELVKRLEKHGLSGRLVLIDGAPELLKTMLEQFLPAITEEELQNNVLLSIMDTVQSASSGKLLLDLEKCTTWEEKLNVFFSHVPDKISLTKTQKKLYTNIYMHILAFRKYDWSSLGWIRSPITLLRPKKSSVDMIEEDYGLHKITHDKVNVYYVEGNHVTMLDNDKVIAAINGESLQDPKEFRKLLTEDRPFEETERTRV